jgi:protoheme IX farnesyltransferase
MKTDALTTADTHSTTRPRTRLGDLLTLAKVRVNALVVATTAGGFYMASPPEGIGTTLVFTCVGTALVASGAAAFNQVYERKTDKLMERTRHRPVAEGRMSALEGLAFAVTLSATGLAILAWTTNLTAVSVAFATLFSYALIYTPLKPVTSLSTVVGAVPGALPPIIGWAAASNSVGGVAPWSLFLISFFWQLPHVLAIAWIYREDYARAGMPMLSMIDPTGGLSGRQSVLWASALVPFSLLPYLVGLAGSAYALGALLLAGAQLTFAVRFARHRSITNARALFYASIIYLPLLWALMVMGRT